MLKADQSKTLIHLVRDGEERSSEDIFEQILQEKILRGFSGDIRGGYNCICLSETPISIIGQVIQQSSDEFRYGPFGFMFTKQYLYNQGARPVIYQPASDYDLLPEELKYLHVRFDGDKTDWTWEREWRLKTESLRLDPEDVTVIVPTRIFVDEMKKKVASTNRSRAIATDGLSPQRILEWHFIALEDLGY